MFNFSANNLTLLSRTECKSCVVFAMKDRHTKRVYRLYDFTKAQTITADQLWCVSGKVNSADKLYLVIETVKADAKNRLSFQPTSES
jgi:20S proteasome alpha/beta subunit